MNIKSVHIKKLVLILLIGFLAAPVFAESGVRTVTSDAFFEALEASQDNESAVVIDIRTPGEFNGGHAPGALNIDYYDSSFSSELAKLDRQEDYYIYCNSGNRSGRSLDLFRELGFESVYDLAGGWSYNAARLKNVKE